MKKLFILLVCVLLSIQANAQHTVYCEMMQFSPGGLSSVIAVDFGNDGADEIVDENGEKIKFNSSVDALAYFERLGWNVVSVYSVVHALGAVNTPVVHYLLKKEVSSYEEKMAGIHTKKSSKASAKKKAVGDNGYFQ